MRLLLDFTRAHPWHSLLTLLCLVVAAGAEAVAFSALLPLISALDPQGAVAAGPASAPKGFEARAIEALQAVGLEPTLGTLLLLVPAVFVIRAALVLLARREIGYTVARVARDLRFRLIRALLGTGWAYFVEQRIGTFANAYSTETMRASRGYLNATWVVMHVLQIIVYVSLAIAISWRVALVAAGIGVALLLVLRPLVRIGRDAGRGQTELLKQVLGDLTDILQGVKPLKAMAREDRVAPLLDESTRGLERAVRRQVFSREAISALQEPIMLGMVCLGLLAMRKLGFNIASMSVMTLAVFRALDSFNKAQARYARVVVQESAYLSLVETIEIAESAREELHGGALPTLERGVELREIRFRHADSDLFEDLSLEIPAGRITAITGASGTGKTTLVDIVVGLLRPDAGAVLVDGVPLDEIDTVAWRSRIGYVPQEMFLLHDTIEMNVGLGDPELSRADIMRALELAHAAEFVSALPDGVETVVGERGSALSGGQRQRIAIARAILKRPILLILDEATAALDPSGEAEVWAAVRELRGTTTVLAISHQPALLEVADRVHVLRDGSAREARSAFAPEAGAASSAADRPAAASIAQTGLAKQ